MSNFSTLTPIVEGISGSAPTLWSASTPDSLATMQVAGYLNDVSKLIKPNDVIYVNYLDLSTFPMNTGLNATFVSMKVVYAAPNWSLVVSAVATGALLAANNLSDVASAPASATNLGLGTANTVTFQNVNAGSSGSAGYLRSYPAAALSGFLELQAANSAGNFAAIITNASLTQNTTWTLQNPGAVASNILQSQGINQMGVGAELLFDKAAVTTVGAGATGTATLSKQSGVLTTPALTTAAGASYIITLTNTLIAANSVLNPSYMGGSNTNANLTISAVPGVGTATITVTNNAPAAAFNGTLVIGFLVH